MDRRQLLSVGSFAKLARTNRHTLHYYDAVGALPAALRGENNYRYYSSAQLSMVNVIHILQELGMTLGEIIEAEERRTPEFMDSLLGVQLEKINGKIDEWVGARKLLLTHQKSIRSALDIDEEAITIQFLPAEAIILGELNDYSGGKDDYNALFGFYRAMRDKHPSLDLNYPVWGKYSEERIRQGDWQWPERYYFYNEEGRDKRPAALYAIGYMRSGYGQNGGLYRRLIDYIDGHGFEICGDAYEEYPLNELSISDDTNYLTRVMITVREKSG